MSCNMTRKFEFIEYKVIILLIIDPIYQYKISNLEMKDEEIQQ